MHVRARCNFKSGEEVTLNRLFKHSRPPLRNREHPPVLKVKFFGEAAAVAVSDNVAWSMTSWSRSEIPGNVRARHNLRSEKEVTVNHVRTHHSINSGEELTNNDYFKHYHSSLRDGEHPSVVKVKFIGDDVTEAVNEIGLWR